MSSNPVSRKNSSATPVNEKAEQRRDVESTSKARTVAVAAFGFLAVLAAGAGFTLALRPEAVGLSNLDAPFKVVAGVGGGLVLGVTGVGAYAYFRSPLLEKLNKELRELQGKLEELKTKESEARRAWESYDSENGDTENKKGELKVEHEQVQTERKKVEEKIKEIEEKIKSEEQKAANPSKDQNQNVGQ